MSESKNNTAWLRLFEKYHIAEEVEKSKFFQISSTRINEFREARLMTKFDHRSQLPSIFSKNGFSILPVSRGSYLISNFETFHNFEKEDVPVEKISFPGYIESIDYRNLTSESAALNCAFVSSMIEDFTEEDELKPTVSGRMSSSEFDFFINSKQGDQRFRVRNSQVEIDGGYEGKNSLNLFEAKNSLSKDFLIRQLYYPFRLWENKIRKKVRPIFFTYSNGVFHFREYEFENPLHYNSIRLVSQKKYSIGEGAINLETIQNLISETPTLLEPDVPFPQADNFPRVINLCELLNQVEKISREEITEKYDFDQRQTNYYTDAGRYLGLIEKKREEGEIIYYLTDAGKHLFKLSVFDRQLEFAKLILSKAVFKKTLERSFEKAEMPNHQEIVEIMKISNLLKIDSETTFSRRASTVSSWTNWILDLIEE